MDFVAMSHRTTFSSSPPVANKADVENAQTRIGEELEC